ncbi:MAG TPA: PEP/pyruvate-binding domain-containing protein, partial [Caulobacter sp.]|nr:PEP/pyruvate-binding domain-containing protein [Caulobacter sp.]
MDPHAPLGRDAPRSDHVRWFSELGLEDVPLVGGKTASLGELFRLLAGAKVGIPDGFAITAAAYRDALTEAGAWPRLEALLAGLDVEDVEDLARRAEAARSIVYAATAGDALRLEIARAFRAMREREGPDLTVAVR